MHTTRRSGFTVVELLIVIVVIAVLAAITVVAYRGVQSRAFTSVIKSYFNQFAKEIALFKARHGNYPDTASELESFEVKFTGEAYGTDHAGMAGQTILYCVNNALDQWGIGAMHSITNEVFLSDGGIAVGQGAGGDLTNCEDGTHVGVDTNAWGIQKAPDESWSDGTICTGFGCNSA